MEEINKATISRLETEIQRLNEMVDRRDAEYDRLCTRFEALEESQTMTNLIELKMSQCDEDFEQAKRIDKKINIAACNFDQAISLLKEMSCILYDEGFYTKHIKIEEFLRKVSEL